MNAIATRPATLNDVEAVAELFDAYRQFYQRQADLPMAIAFMRERIARAESVVIVACNVAGGVVGFCQLYPLFCSVAAAPIYILYDLFVAPKARKSGVGRALLLAAERHAEQHGFARMELSTAKTNLPAQALYESLGWVRDEAFQVYAKAVRRNAKG